jgi:hypothetical protein
MALLALLLAMIFGGSGSGYHALPGHSHQHVQPADSFGEGGGG